MSCCYCELSVARFVLVVRGLGFGPYFILSVGRGEGKSASDEALFKRATDPISHCHARYEVFYSSSHLHFTISLEVAWSAYVRCFGPGNAACNSPSRRYGRCCAMSGSERRTTLRTTLSGPVRCRRVRLCHRSQQERPNPLHPTVPLCPPPPAHWHEGCRTAKHTLGWV